MTDAWYLKKESISQYNKTIRFFSGICCITAQIRQLHGCRIKFIFPFRKFHTHRRCSYHPRRKYTAADRISVQGFRFWRL